MKNWQLALLGLGTVGIVAYLLWQGQEYEINLDVLPYDGSMGTSNPAPGTIRRRMGSSLTITALPGASFSVQSWKVDNVVKGTATTFTYTFDHPYSQVVLTLQGGIA